jgi:ABC-type glycerol-3-phosphate transport system permease component
MAADAVFEKTAPAAHIPGRRRISTGKIILQIFVVLLGISWLVPLWLLVITPMKTVDEYLSSSQWALPQNPFNLFQNIDSAWSTAGLGPGFTASLIYGTIGAALAILVASMGAYAVTRLRIRLPFFWFMLVFSGTIFPFQMYLIPLFKAYTNYGLYDTRLGMILFYTAIAIPFCLFVMRAFFYTVPREIQEAARIDGGSDFHIFWRIFLPLARGPIAVLFLFQFTWIWNDLLFGLVLATSDGIRPIMPSLIGMQGIYAHTGPPTVLAGALIASLPTVVLFLLLRRYMIQGLTLTTSAAE